jgi:hypothetical protein
MAQVRRQETSLSSRSAGIAASRSGQAAFMISHTVVLKESMLFMENSCSSTAMTKTVTNWSGKTGFAVVVVVVVVVVGGSTLYVISSLLSDSMGVLKVTTL